MEVIIKRYGEILKTRKLPFSINDIVTIISYGNRYASQRRAFEGSTLNNTTPLKEWCGDIYPYEKCDKYFSKEQWKIIDVGAFKGTTIIHEVIVRLINRNKNEILIKCELDDPNQYFQISRKGKKQYKKYIINL